MCIFVIVAGIGTEFEPLTGSGRTLALEGRQSGSQASMQGVKVSKKHKKKI